MSDAKVRGVIHVIEETKTYGQKGFRKRLVVLEQDDGRFTNYVPVEFTQDRCESVDDLSVGDEIEITYRLNGRKWQTLQFTRDPLKTETGSMKTTEFIRHNGTSGFLLNIIATESDHDLLEKDFLKIVKSFEILDEKPQQAKKSR